MTHRGKKHIRKTKDIAKEQKKIKLAEKEERKRGIKKVLVDIADLPRISREAKEQFERSPKGKAQEKLDIEFEETKLRGIIRKKDGKDVELGGDLEPIKGAPREGEKTFAEGEVATPRELSNVQKKINQQRIERGEEPLDAAGFDTLAEETSFSAVIQKFKDKPLETIGENLGLAIGASALMGGVNLIGKAGTAFFTSKIGISFAGTVIGADALALWLGSDNYHFQNGTAANLLIEAYENDPSEANKQTTLNELEELKSELEFVGGKTRFSVAFNPFIILTGKGKVWLMNQEEAENNLQRKIDSVEGSNPIDIANEKEFFEQNRNRKLGIE